MRFAYSVGVTAILACSGSTRVTRTAPDSSEGADLSGYWNDRDAQQVADTMIADCLDRPWIESFQTAQERRPVIKLMGVIKRTDDPNVRTSFFTKQIERALLNSGRVRVVASFGQDMINVVERGRQSVFAGEETAKSHGEELAPDFTVQTFVNSQNETDGDRRSVRAYLVTMEMVSVSTNEKVWIGEEQIRKVIDGPMPEATPDDSGKTAKAREAVGELSEALHRVEPSPDVAPASEEAMKRLLAAARSDRPSDRRGSGVLDKWSPAVFEYLLLKTYQEEPKTEEDRRRRQREMAFLFASLCTTAAMPFEECVALGLRGDPDRIKEAFGVADPSLEGILKAEEENRVKRMAGLDPEVLSTCKLGRVVGSYDPNGREEDPFVQLTKKSLSASYWRSKVRRFHSVRFDCGNQTALVVFTDYSNRPELRIFGWRFMESTKWQTIREAAESAFIHGAAKL